MPREVYDTIMESAYRHFRHARRRPRILRWSAAAAAIIIVSVLVTNVFRKEDSARLHTAGAVLAEDIDRNGMVNIIDAFKLARHIESGRKLKTGWDINNDGQVNRGDVDYVANVAVRLHKKVI